MSLDYLVGRDFSGSQELALFEKKLINASRQMPAYMNEYMLAFLEFMITKKSN